MQMTEMKRRRVLRIVLASAIVIITVAAIKLNGQTSGAQSEKPAMLLTIFLKHDQSKTLDEINEQLKRTGFNDKFPPPGVEVVSWYVMMGIGQVVTLRVPPDKLREVNLAIEHGAWGAFRTEFYATYDYKPVWEASRKAAR